MPKYIKLFESFINEALAYKFDPTKTVLTGAAVYSAGTSYAKFALGRIYIATADSESTKKAPGNVLVYLTAKSKDIEKKLTDLGGVAAALQASEINTAHPLRAICTIFSCANNRNKVLIS